MYYSHYSAHDYLRSGPFGIQSCQKQCQLVYHSSFAGLVNHDVKRALSCCSNCRSFSLVCGWQCVIDCSSCTYCTVQCTTDHLCRRYTDLYSVLYKWLCTEWQMCILYHLHPTPFILCFTILAFPRQPRLHDHVIHARLCSSLASKMLIWAQIILQNLTDL